MESPYSVARADLRHLRRRSNGFGHRDWTGSSTKQPKRSFVVSTSTTLPGVVIACSCSQEPKVSPSVCKDLCRADFGWVSERP